MSPSTSSTSKSSGLKAGPLVTIIGLVIISILTLCYFVTGLDPSSLFSIDLPGMSGEATATGPASPETAPSPTAATSSPAAPAAETVEPTAIIEATQTIPGSQGGEWWQVYFTDPITINKPYYPKGSIPEKLIEYIDRAQETIHIAVFEFNLTPVAEALIAADKRGVKVKWITDDENGLEADVEYGRGQFAKLEKAGIKVIGDGREALMHDKFLIFDQKIVWTGSTNLTVNDNFRNNNNIIIFDSPEIAAIYERQFADMWAGKFGSDSPSTIDQQKVTIKKTPVQILFSPEDNVLSHLIELVNAAKQSVYFMAYSYTHDGLTNAMLSRSQAGVRVKGIFETRSSETEYGALRPMYCAKLPVRQDGNPGTFHHKVIVIDEKIVITGSLNFSVNADEINNENTVIITRAKVAAVYLQEFERRWVEAVEPSAEAMKCK